jgi:hypothetical protein
LRITVFVTTPVLDHVTPPSVDVRYRNFPASLQTTKMRPSGLAMICGYTRKVPSTTSRAASQPWPAGFLRIQVFSSVWSTQTK